MCVWEGKKHLLQQTVFQAPIADAMAVVWEFFQPLLFGLIGAEVSIEYMDSTLIGRSWEHDFVNNAQILIILTV